jgi:hypothetical protein
MQSRLIVPFGTTNELQEKNEELELALSEINALRGLLPICAQCERNQDIALRKKAEEEKKVLESQLRGKLRKWKPWACWRGAFAHDF